MMSKQAARRPGRRSSQSQSYHRAAMAAATSWPTQKAGRHTSEPVLACPTSGPSRHSRSTCASSPPPAGMQSRSASPWPRRKRSSNVPEMSRAWAYSSSCDQRGALHPGQLERVWPRPQPRHTKFWFRCHCQNLCNFFTSWIHHQTLNP